MDKQILIGMIMITAGLGLVVFRQRFVEYIVAVQNKAFGFKFGQRTIDWHVWLAIPFGVLIVLIGSLMLTGVWELK